MSQRGGFGSVSCIPPRPPLTERALTDLALHRLELGSLPLGPSVSCSSPLLSRCPLWLVVVPDALWERRPRTIRRQGRQVLPVRLETRSTVRMDGIALQEISNEVVNAAVSEVISPMLSTDGSEVELEGVSWRSKLSSP